ncbi:MAG: hypothetical protein MUC34_10500, partial [Anaerolineae bacterium]|nr:hypothetical protein [Anaerolineae bacterium]
GAAGDARPRIDPDVKPVLTVTALVAAFVALGVLLTVLSAIASLGGGGFVLVICGFPVALISLIAWLINANRPGAKAQAAPAADPWTIDGTATEVKQEPQGEARTATTPPPAGRGVPIFGPREQADQRKAAPAKAAAKAKPAPERPPVSPAEYRQRAASYRRKIQSLIKTRRPGPIAERMTGVLAKLKSWEDRVGQLADRLTLYEKDDLIQRDIRETPGHIDRLQRQLAMEAEPEMQRQIKRTLAAYREQQRQLELLGKMMKRTRLNLDDTLAAMGTVYSQLQVLNAMDIDGPTAARIAGDVDREVERLNDLLAAVSDVYASSSETPQQSAADEDADAGLTGRKARLGGSAAS